MDYTYWRNALAGDFGPVHDSDPQAGFYRKRVSRGGPFVPVAIFEHEGKPVALVNGSQADADEVWTYVCQHPIKEDWYHTKMGGAPWPDEDGAVAASLAPPPAGHNNPPQDEAEVLSGQIDAAAAGIGDYAEIKDDETAARAQSLRSRLLELSGDADKKREAEKAPHLEAGRAIDKKWQPLVKAAKAAADRIRDALGAHETRKARAAAEAARKVEEERRRLEALAAKARPAAKLLPPAAAPPPPAPEPVTAIRGAYGRAAAVKVVKVATVTDQDAAYGYLKNRPEVVDLIAKLAQRAVDAGYDVPGTEVSTERKVA